MISFKWNDEKMNIGVDIIDKQHKELLKIINQLSTSINMSSQKDDILVIIDELIDYANFHFKTEEKIFDEFANENTKEHKKEHDLFREKFFKIKDKINNDKLYKISSTILIADEIFAYMLDWFLHHILESDKKLIQKLKEKNIKL